MAAGVFSDYSNPLASVAQNQSQDRAQFAQYSIIRASEFMRDGRMEDAIGAFKQALNLDPTNTTATTYIGNINLSLGRNADAIDAFKQLVRQNPNSSDGHMQLGNAYLSDGQLDQSESEFKTAARLDPTNPVPDYTLGMQYLQAGKLTDAENQFLKVQRLAPGDANVYYALGKTYNEQGDTAKAIDTLNTSLSLKPNNPPANYELGVAYDKLGDSTAAKNQLTTLQDAGSPLAQDLAFIVQKPGIAWLNGATSTFNTNFGAGTPVWFEDTSLLSADSNKSFSVDIQFSSAMDVTSVMNPSNWSITKANNTQGGYYNNSMAANPSTEANVLRTPTSVTYNSLTGVARVSFSISQNSDVTAKIDPSHLVFKFSGTDAYGRKMDTAADEIDGFSSSKPF
jgi:Flp pilus assembly protein TadD